MTAGKGGATGGARAATWTTWADLGTNLPNESLRHASVARPYCSPTPIGRTVIGRACFDTFPAAP